MRLLKILLILFCTLFSYSAFSAELKITTANEIIHDLAKRNEENKILFFFTSWCPYCKTTIDQVLQGSHKNVVFISLDKDYSKIATMSTRLPEELQIYYMKNTHEIIELFSQLHIKYSGSIPYISILNKDNDLIKDDINYRQLYKYLK